MNGTYGIVKPSILNPALDVEVWYHYRPTRNSEDSSFTNFRQIENVNEVITVSTRDMATVATGDTDNTLPGMFQLKLPLTYFNQRGFYTIYIKPREMVCTIKDIGSLSTYPDVRGIVLDLNEIDTQFSSIFENNQLSGYRIEFIDNGVRQNIYRIVTTNAKCEPVTQNLVSNSSKSNGYRYNDSATYTFITVTPSLAPSFKPNATPFIGRVGQQIIVTNTKFNPICLEVELVAHDIETVTNMLEGNQIRSLDKGLVTTYNDDNEIYNQTEFFTVADPSTGRPMSEVRKKRNDNIDTTIDSEGMFNL